MDYDKLIERLRTDSLYADRASLEIMDLCMDAATAISTLQTVNSNLRDRVSDLETRARTERCDAADYDCRELGALRREVSALRERLADPPKKEEV